MKYKEPLLDIIELEKTAILTVNSGGEWEEDLDGPIDAEIEDI